MTVAELAALYIAQTPTPAPTRHLIASLVALEQQAPVRTLTLNALSSARRQNLIDSDWHITARGTELLQLLRADPTWSIRIDTIICELRARKGA